MVMDWKLERIKRGLRQIELARLAGIDRSRLSMIENGWLDAKAEELKKIRRVIAGYGKKE